MFIILDIEVIQQDPEPFMVRRAEEFTPPANYKKPETIAEWRAEQVANQLEELRTRSSLEPLLGGTVLAVGVARDAASPVAMIAPSGDETGERALLAQLEGALQRYPDHTLVTFNGTRYDLTWLAKRALRHGLYGLSGRCQRAAVEKPWGDRRKHVDLFAAWQMGDRQAIGKLRHVAAFLGIESDDKVTGAEISELYAAGNLDAVRGHVLEDVRLTREVYWRMICAGWVSGDEPAHELAVRPPRLLPRQQLELELRQAQVDAAAQDLKRAAEAAGIAWNDDVEDGASGPRWNGPDVTVVQLRAFLDALRHQVDVRMGVEPESGAAK